MVAALTGRNDSASELGLAGIQLLTGYRTGQSDPVQGFYRPCLLKARRYDRAVGYFRSSIYILVGAATVELLGVVARSD